MHLVRYIKSLVIWAENGGHEGLTPLDAIALNRVNILGCRTDAL